MKKFILFLTMSTLLLLCSSCGRINITSETKNECKQIIDCLSNDDTAGLKALFCETVSSESDFDDQLTKAVEIFDGKVISYDIEATGANEIIAEGKQSIVHVTPYIGKIVTDTDKNYIIRYSSYLVNLENPNYVGISELSIECEDGQAFVIGDYDKVHIND